MSAVRFPNDDIVKKSMKQQDNFWRRLEKEKSKARDESLGVKSQEMKPKN